MAMFITRGEPVEDCQQIMNLSVSGFSLDIQQTMIPICVIAVKGRILQPLRLVSGRAIHKGLSGAAHLRCFLSLSNPLLNLKQDWCSLIHLRTFFEPVKEFQHWVIHTVDLPLDTLSLSRHLEEEGYVVLACYHQGVFLNSASTAKELGSAFGGVHHHVVVRLALFKSAIYENTRHLSSW